MKSIISILFPYALLTDFVGYLISYRWTPIKPNVLDNEVFHLTHEDSEYDIVFYDINNSEFLGCDDSFLTDIEEFTKTTSYKFKNTDPHYMSILDNARMGLNNTVYWDMRPYFCTSKKVFLTEGDIEYKKCLHKFSYNGAKEYVCKWLIDLNQVNKKLTRENENQSISQ